MSVRVNIIVAMAENGVIGRNGDLPWRLSTDLKRFKDITTGHSIVMGRKTFESLPRVLPQRRHTIITRQKNYQHAMLNKQCVVVDSLDSAMALDHETGELMVIGGAEIYRLALKVARRAFITNIHAPIDGNVCFPEFQQAWWTLTYRSEKFFDRDAAFDYSFSVFERA